MRSEVLKRAVAAMKVAISKDDDVVTITSLEELIACIEMNNEMVTDGEILEFNQQHIQFYQLIIDRIKYPN